MGAEGVVALEGVAVRSGQVVGLREPLQASRELGVREAALGRHQLNDIRPRDALGDEERSPDGSGYSPRLRLHAACSHELRPVDADRTPLPVRREPYLPELPL